MTKLHKPRTYDIELLCQILKSAGAPMSRIALSVIANKDRHYVDERGPLLEQHPNIIVSYRANITYYQWRS